MKTKYEKPDAVAGSPCSAESEQRPTTAFQYKGIECRAEFHEITSLHRVLQLKPQIYQNQTSRHSKPIWHDYLTRKTRKTLRILPKLSITSNISRQGVNARQHSAPTDFTLEPSPTSSMDFDFDPPVWHEEEQMEQEFLALFEGIRSSTRSTDSANPSEEISQLAGGVYRPGMDFSNFTADEILRISEIGGDDPNLSAGATLENPVHVSDSPSPDFANQDCDMTDFYNYLNQEDCSTALSDWTGVPAQPSTQNANDATLDAQHFNDAEALASDETGDAPIDLDDFNVDELLGTGAEGLSNFIPQPLITSPAAPQPLSGVANLPASNPVSAFPSLLVNNNGGRKGHFILLKAGKLVCNVDPGSVPAVLDAISQSRPQGSVLPQQQGHPALDFSYLDATDGAPASQVDFTVRNAAPLGNVNWEDELAAMTPPPPRHRLAPIINTYNLRSSGQLRPSNEQQPLNVTPRMVTKSRDREARTPPNGVGKTQPWTAKKVIKPVEGSDYARHRKEAEARSEALGLLEREQAPSPESLPSSPESSGGGKTKLRNPKKVGTRTFTPQKDSDYARHREEAIARALREGAPSPESLPPPSPPPARPSGSRVRITPSGRVSRRPRPGVRHARPRPMQRDRAQLRTHVNEVSKEKESGPMYSRRATRTFAKAHNIELESLKF